MSYQHHLKHTIISKQDHNQIRNKFCAMPHNTKVHDTTKLISLSRSLLPRPKLQLPGFLLSFQTTDKRSVNKHIHSFCNFTFYAHKSTGNAAFLIGHGLPRVRKQHF